MKTLTTERLTEMLTKARGLLAVLVLTVSLPAVAEAGTRVTVYDVVTTPGKTVTLRAKCERTFGRWIHPDLEGKTVEFKLDGRSLGKAVTDEQGIASVSLTPSAVGVSVLSARIVGKRAVGTGQVRVIPPSKPVIVFDIDGTIIDLGATGAADMAPGDAIVIRTPGGGGYGKP